MIIGCRSFTNLAWYQVKYRTESTTNQCPLSSPLSINSMTVKVHVGTLPYALVHSAPSRAVLTSYNDWSLLLRQVTVSLMTPTLCVCVGVWVCMCVCVCVGVGVYLSPTITDRVDNYIG